MRHDKSKESRKTCQICNKELTKESYNVHMRIIHMDNKEVTCDMCQKTFKGSYYLNQHKQSQHSGKPKKVFKCEVCASVFTLKSNLQMHMGTHNGTVLKCPECDKVFSRNSDLRTHIRFIHEQERKWKCDKCGKRFRAEPMLKTHVNAVHEKIRHTCDQCGKDFAYEYYLKLHKQKVHEGINTSEKQCKVCSKFTKNSSQLKVHMESVHEGKRYQCDMCDKDFSAKGALFTHKKEYHSEIVRKFPCGICNKNFDTPTR